MLRTAWLAFDQVKALENLRAVATPTVSAPTCPSCFGPWPFVDGGCEWCGLAANHNDAIARADFLWGGQLESFFVHRRCSHDMQGCLREDGELPFPAYTVAMIMNASIDHVSGHHQGHAHRDVSCPICWNISHELAEDWEPSAASTGSRKG